MSSYPSFKLETIEDWTTLSKRFYGSDSARKSTMVKSAEDMFLLLIYAHELGMTPAQGIQYLVIVNGKIVMKAEGLLALVFRSGELLNIDEEVDGFQEDNTKDKKDTRIATCTVVRKMASGSDKSLTASFSISDAKTARLYPCHPALPWMSYTERMLKMRARTFALRDLFPDVLRGLTSQEEAMDYKDLAKIKAQEKNDKYKEQKEYVRHQRKPLEAIPEKHEHIIVDHNKIKDPSATEAIMLKGISIRVFDHLKDNPGLVGNKKLINDSKGTFLPLAAGCAVLFKDFVAYKCEAKNITKKKEIKKIYFNFFGREEKIDELFPEFISWLSNTKVYEKATDLVEELIRTIPPKNPEGKLLFEEESDAEKPTKESIKEKAESFLDDLAAEDFEKQIEELKKEDISEEQTND